MECTQWENWHNSEDHNKGKMKEWGVCCFYLEICFAKLERTHQPSEKDQPSEKTSESKGIHHTNYIYLLTFSSRMISLEFGLECFLHKSIPQSQFFGFCSHQTKTKGHQRQDCQDTKTQNSKPRTNNRNNDKIHKNRKRIFQNSDDHHKQIVSSFHVKWNCLEVTFFFARGFLRAFSLLKDIWV